MIHDHRELEKLQREWAEKYGGSLGVVTLYKGPDGRLRNYEQNKAFFAEQLKKAEAGDAEAVGGLVAAAERLTQSAWDAGKTRLSDDP